MKTTRIGAIVVAAAAVIATSTVPTTAQSGDGDGGRRTLDRPPADYSVPFGPGGANDLSTDDAPPLAAGRAAITGDCNQPENTDRRGDATGVDIVTVSITSDCSLWTVTSRFARPVDLARIGGWAINLDTRRGRGGCFGGERSIVLSRSTGRPEALIVTTPSCDRNTWVTIGRVPLNQPDPRTLQVTFSADFMHAVDEIRWSVGASTGDGQSFDTLPDDEGTVAMLPPVLAPSAVDWTLTRDDLYVYWSGTECARRQATYDITNSTNGAPARRVVREDPTDPMETITGLAPESTNVISITSVCGERRSQPYVFTVVVPMGADLPTDGPFDRSDSPEVRGSVASRTTHSRGQCDQPVERDRQGDGTIDVASVRITSDCQRTQFTLTTHRPFSDAELGNWTVLIGPGTFCDGMKWVVYVSGGSRLSAELLPIAGECFVSGGARSLAVERLSPTSVRFTLPRGVLRSAGFTWYSYTDGPDGEGTDGASAYTVAGRLLLEAPRLRLESSRVSGVAYVHPTTRQSVDYIEVQHRRPGKQWSGIIRTTGPTELALVPAVRHEVRVRSVYQSSRSAWTTKSITVIVPPSPLRNIEITATDDMLTIEFRRPARTGGRPLSFIKVVYETGLAPKRCDGRSLRCEFPNPNYPGIVTLWSGTTVSSTVRTSPRISIAVPDPTP